MFLIVGPRLLLRDVVYPDGQSVGVVVEGPGITEWLVCLSVLGVL